MKKFLDILKNKKNAWKESPMIWDSSFAEQREKKEEPPKEKPKTKMLGWASSFAELRGKKDVKESRDDPKPETLNKRVVSHNKFNTLITDHFYHKRGGKNEYGGEFSETHAHPKVAPSNLTDEHIDRIKSYTGTSESSGPGYSGNMNRYLRNRSGDKSWENQNLSYNDKNSVEHAVKRFSSAFTKENTNRKSVLSFTGVPTRISDQLKGLPHGSEHHLAGFTSTSTNPKTASHFGVGSYNNDNSTSTHMIALHVKPGAGLSVAHHSLYDENEITLHHGAKITYHGHEHFTHYNDSMGTHHITLHHATVHAEHKPLHEYGKFTEAGEEEETEKKPHRVKVDHDMQSQIKKYLGDSNDQVGHLNV